MLFNRLACFVIDIALCSAWCTTHTVVGIRLCIYVLPNVPGMIHFRKGVLVGETYRPGRAGVPIQAHQLCLAERTICLADFSKCGRPHWSDRGRLYRVLPFREHSDISNSPLQRARFERRSKYSARDMIERERETVWVLTIRGGNIGLWVFGLLSK